MYKSFAVIGASIALAGGAVSMPSLAPSPLPASPMAILAQQQQGKAVRNKERREAHPEIRKAIVALESAKRDLQRASHDFGGHRAEALEACDRAIAQLRLALQYDKR